MLSPFVEHKFQARVNKALEKVKTILDNTRNPQYPADVHHEYEDKFILSDFLTTSAIAALLNNLEYLGISEKPLQQLREWAKTKNVTLRLKAEESTKFLRKDTREVESDTKHVTKAGILGKFESFTVKKVTEYIWQFTVKWELVAFVGVDADKGIVLQSRTGSTELKTSVETTPRPEVVVRPPIDVNITWLIQHIDENRTPGFSINRASKLCRTPRRNPDVEDALKFLNVFHSWAQRVHTYFIDVFNQQLNHGLDLSSINDTGVFNPVLPLFESNSPSSSSNSNSNSPSSKIPPVFINSFLAEQARSLDEKKKDLAKVFTVNDKLITIVEATILVTLLHSKQVAEAYSEGVDYIENLLYKQLVAAIGKTVTPTDFANYMTFHNRKVYKSEYRPQAFSYAIRRPDHYPEGVLSLEAQLSGESLSNPVSTIVAGSPATRPMKFSINAATNISFLGDRYLHGYIAHQFSGLAELNLSLCARARQFSSFILLVGRIVSADLFDPKHAIIIQNKDELKIPLILETIPTPKEFKDAIASLSPEQQRFCKAFRSMQLESTLFGVCVIQIKPQLEKLLKLPDDSLTKEIQLTQDLLNMFIKYQIPSDLVSYDGPAESSKEAKIAQVKEYVGRMQAMLDSSKKAELEAAQQQQKMRLAQPTYDSYASLPPSVPVPVMPIMAMMESAPMARSLSVSRSRAAPAPGGAPPPPRSAAPPPPPPTATPSFSAPPPPHPAYAPAPPPPALAPQAPSEVAKPRDVSQNKEQWKDVEGAKVSQGGVTLDYTKIPTELEQKFDKFDENNALRPTIINIGETWSKSYQKSLLSEPEKKQVYSAEQTTEKNKAFDLLDALTKSGAISVDYASLHVVIASTHCFDKSLIQTVVEDNVNPIEKLENSSLIVASTIHQIAPAELIAPEHLDRISSTTAPLLLEDNRKKIEA